MFVDNSFLISVFGMTQWLRAEYVSDDILDMIVLIIKLKFTEFFTNSNFLIRLFIICEETMVLAF